ncbi:Lysophosphatidylcholine acyltransferase 1 [Triticum urartu]|uniref:Lysophosphatidylcholine acyltransferase 1 n=1 Tax=Triticum urartu TaxID=4572 RepID=M7Z462_TRIUA|nr:Lysophosphatidylcholine acyltransferase 1 [Triticum urartu]
MPAWRRRLMWVTRLSARCILFSFGIWGDLRCGTCVGSDFVWWGRRRRRISSEGTGVPVWLISQFTVGWKLILARSFSLWLAFAWVCRSHNIAGYILVNTQGERELYPRIEEDNYFNKITPDNLVTSLLIGGMDQVVRNVIYVDRFSPASRKSAVNEIKRKAAGNSFPRVLLFPEGTTTNGRFLISFQHGAFIPGYPVQPVVVRYPHVHFDQSWGNISLIALMFKMFTQFHNFMEVEYLPIVYPPEIKQENALHFAENTSYAMAHALNVLPTSYSYADSMIASRAEEAGKANCSSYMVEMAWVKEVYGVSTAEAMELLEHFLAMNPDSDGRVKAQDFWALFGLYCSPLCKKIFHYFDFENKESITFRQFLVGCAHLRKQPLFEGVCETAFEKCKAPGTSDISLAQLADALRSGMLPPADDGMLKLFETFDIDDDDKISRDDFVACLARFPFMIALFAGRINGEVYIEIV